MATAKKAVAPKAKKAVKKTADPVEKKVHKKTMEGIKPGLAHVLIRPWITEKAAYAADKGAYTFEVDLRATKGQIGDAFRAIYGIAPIKVATTIVKPNMRIIRGRLAKERGYKKAMIYVPAGTSIEFI